MSESDPAQAGQEERAFVIEVTGGPVVSPITRTVLSAKEWAALVGTPPVFTRVYSTQGHGTSLDGFSIPPDYIEAEAVNSAFETDFSALLAQLDTSDAATGERQAVITELRQSTETALSELAEAVAAL